MNIYVSNLSFNVQDEDLKALFTPYGEVASAKIIMDRATSRSRGFGFVEMADEAGKQAIVELDGTTVQSRAMKVNEAKPKTDKPARSNSPFRSDNEGYNNTKSYNQNRY
jgi:RNA recognition motif-containing protein